MIRVAAHIKVAECLGLGFLLWSLNLLWPAINQIALWPVLVGAVIGLNVLVIYLLLGHYLEPRHRNSGPGRNPPSQPVPVVG